MLYKLNKVDPQSSREVAVKHLSDFGLKEKDLENFLGSRLTELISEEHLMLIGQERAFQEEADLFALDENGTLYIFELKRWESTSEDLLQVLRYGQKFGRYSYGELQDLARRHGKLEGDLQERHAETFGISPLEESDFNRDQVFVVVTNGADKDTISAINYWSSKGLNVVCLPYSVYDVGGDPYLQIHTYDPEGDVVVETNPQHFVVNTNRYDVPSGWNEMIGDSRTGKAAAYGNRKHTIKRIPKGATVFLYHTQVGFIAKGKSTSDFEEVSDNEICVRLKFGWVLAEATWEQQAPTAWDINQRLQTGHRFRQTVFAIDEKMVDAIDSIAKEKGIREG